MANQKTKKSTAKTPKAKKSGGVNYVGIIKQNPLFSLLCFITPLIGLVLSIMARPKKDGTAKTYFILSCISIGIILLLCLVRLITYRYV